MIKLFHGTNESSAKSIVYTGIDLKKSQKYLDFGFILLQMNLEQENGQNEKLKNKIEEIISLNCRRLLYFM